MPTDIYIERVADQLSAGADISLYLRLSLGAAILQMLGGIHLSAAAYGNLQQLTGRSASPIFVEPHRQAERNFPVSLISKAELKLQVVWNQYLNFACLSAVGDTPKESSGRVLLLGTLFAGWYLFNIWFNV